MLAHARQEYLRSGSFHFSVIVFDSQSLQGHELRVLAPCLLKGTEPQRLSPTHQ